MAENKKEKVEIIKRKRGRPRKTLPKVNFPKTDEIETIILSKTDPGLDVVTDSLPFEEIVESWSGQIEELKSKINGLESQAKIAKKEFAKLENQTNQLSNERSKLKIKVQKDQDLIYELENRLESLEETHYRADMPDFLRFFVGLFKHDEINIRTKITKAETRVIQRETRIIQQSSDLATSWIYRQAYDSILTTYQNLTEFYRKERGELGKLRRDFIQNERKESNENLKSSILQDFKYNIQKINQESRSFAENISQSRTNFNNSLDQVKKTLPNDLNKLVDNLIQKKSSKEN
jgi:hypothetical protein